MKKLLTLILIGFTLNAYSQIDTIDAIVIEEMVEVRDLVSDSTKYTLLTSEGNVLCEKDVYDHVLRNVAYRGVFLTKIDGSKWLIEIKEY